MSKVLDRVKSPETEKVSDLEKLLEIAESLQEKCEAGRHRIENYRVLQIGLVGILLSVAPVVFWFSWGGSLDARTKFTFVTVATMSLINAAVMEVVIRTLKRRTLPDRIALADLVELLRETESALGEAENWSTLDRAQFRIRLSRFGIGCEQPFRT